LFALCLNNVKVYLENTKFKEMCILCVTRNVVEEQMDKSKKNQWSVKKIQKDYDG